jgi:type I restriction enzyme R subunit
MPTGALQSALSRSGRLTTRGVMDAALLYASPFTDITPRGPDGLFSAAQVEELLSVLEQVRAAALVA